MAETKKDQLVDRAFYISLLLKAADSVLEILGGIFLLVVSPERIGRVVVDLTQHELSQDPHDFIANHLLTASHHLTHSGTLFGAFYLLSHGVIKLVLIVALLKQKLWAYPWLIGVLGAFIIYQVYRLVGRFSVVLTLLTIFDVFVVWLTWLEYQRHKRLAQPT